MENTEKLDARSKWCYSIGATGRDAAYALVSMFLMSYIQYTMKLTVAQFSVIGIIIVVCMVWDAINDPLMGIIIENCHMKMGKYRPWILMGSILNALVIIALFTLRPTGWAFVGFFGVGYLCWGMTYTMNDIAYWGMLPSLTSNAKERNLLVTLMGIFVCVGQFAVAGVVPMVIAGNAINAYRIVALVVALCFIAFQVLTVLGVKEKKHASETTEKLGLKDMFRIFAKNDQLIPAGIASLLFNIGNGLLIMFGMNFFYFEFGYSKGGDLVFIFTIMYGVGTLIGEFIFPLLSKYFHRKKLLLFFICFTCYGYILLLLIGHGLPKNVVLINIIGFWIFFCQSVLNMLIIVMLNNTIEYYEVKFNERHDSIISTVRSFSAKLSGAINQGIVNLTLIVSGIYAISQKISDLEVRAGTGEILHDEVLAQADTFISTASNMQLFILRLGITIIPITAFIICLVILKKKYKIDEKMYEELLQEINSRKVKSNGN
ncbi:MAG: glycoside-pentoside-hexuronide (GPH):cation symporter [Treponemataceae bacterium]|nr:glycoside-pentoside-hexuronide (GPH):cation symporter [Treponemataceae bacterium]